MSLYMWLTAARLLLSPALLHGIPAMVHPMHSFTTPAAHAVPADFQPGGGSPVGPSAVPICDNDFKVYAQNGAFKYPTPRALKLDEVPGII